MTRATRILVAGAGGVVGRPLIAMLVAAGHDITGTTRSPGHAAQIATAGARAVIVDILDAGALSAALADSQPDVVIHQVTDLALGPGEVLGDDQLARNALVREIGTRNLVGAAAASGVRRVIAQSIAWLYLPGLEPHTEDQSIVPSQPAAIDPTRRAVIELERLVTTDRGFGGIVLRYGRLYGPGTWAEAPNKPPAVHVDAAARAALLAVDRGEPGIYNIVNDGDLVSNAKARRVLGWVPS